MLYLFMSPYKNCIILIFYSYRPQAQVERMGKAI